DEAAQLTSSLLATQPGQRVLDACAAPGGKTAHILETTQDLKELVALDQDPRRLDRLKENLIRLGLTATVLEGDATEPSRWWDGIPFDRILIDAPCSATGVIRRHPDIKFLRQEEQFPMLIQQQDHILRALWPLLAPGGTLLYATCSIIPRENESRIALLLSLFRDAKVVPITAKWGQQRKFGRQILPGEDEMDGFYFALLRKGDG
ncbi:MAG: 16S rRNA (cytosine(967)-C(5))-methyltransferase, partial [Gammaproteobacteria bacterium]|nr:16S rRNA (cytosine(967)-C(5))-methyltransferase [Gammaproteobacteria bacterium]